MSQIKPRLVMIYGESGSTKTTQLYFIAKWLKEKYGQDKKIRLIHGDPGGYAPFEDSGMIERKEIELFDYTNRKLALADFRRLSEGYWPRYTQGGQEVFQTIPECLTTNFNNYCAYFIESLTSIGARLLQHASDVEAKIGSEGPSWTYVEDNYTYKGVGKSHYGVVQKELRARLVEGFGSLPVPWIFVTALTSKGEDKSTRESVFGPQAIGSALTSVVPSWFGGGCFHLDTARVKKQDGTEADQKVAWFLDHAVSSMGIEGVRYLAKSRVLPEHLPQLFQEFPGGKIPLGVKGGVDKYFRFIEKLNKGE